MMDLPVPDFLPILLAALLFATATTGHFCLVIWNHNRWYAGPLSPRVTDAVQVTHGLLALAGPVVFWWIYGFDLGAAFRDLHSNPWHLIGAGYLVLCWVLALLVFPALTLRRWLAGRPLALLSNHTCTVDIAAELGYRPAGDGTYRLLSRLPGNECFQVDFAEKTLCLPGLPAEWDGLSILHLSDLHFCGTPDRRFYQQVMEHCAAWEPDLLAMTGDVLDSDRHLRWIVPVLGRLRWRLAAFAILGNHDLHYDPPLIRRRLRRLGMQVLDNSWMQVEVHGRPMVVIGHEGPWFLPGPDLSGCPSDVFRLCLSHTPDNIRWARRHDIDLMLSGHNHGGQIRFPLIGSVVVPSRYGRRYDGGTFEESPTLLHVVRGLGGEHPLRYNCRPEVAKLVLRRGEGAAAC
jgi:predicted MPP superfamily phosphohydrolase